MGEGPRETAGAVSAASRYATTRTRSERNAQRPRRKRTGSLALTAIVVTGFLVAMLILMVKYSQ